MDAKSNLLKYIKLKSISKAEFYKKTGLSNGFLDKNSNISSNNLEIIISVFEDLSPDWLLTGRGEMLRDTTSIVQEPPPIYMKSETCEKCLEKEELIKVMKITIDTQKELIDCLQTLKNNCKQPEKKSQTSSQFPNMSANIK
jgi:tRNA(Phe) wybutosine-synthesizing methylase Tyw3